MYFDNKISELIVQICTVIEHLHDLIPSLVGAGQLSDDVHSVHIDVLIVQVSVPLPQGMGGVLESQDTMAISRLTEG